VGWRVVWGPEEVYARALADAATNKKFAKTRAGRPWSEIPRLPAFPIIVGREFMVTPFGKIAAEDGSAGEKAGIRPPAKLVQHAQRWTGRTLQDDPGSANVDVLLLAGASWKRATRALMAPAMEGLFRIYLVGRGAAGLVGFAAAAPVFGELASKGAALVVAMSSGEEKPGGVQVEGGKDAARYAFRIRVGENLLASTEKPEKENSCAPEATFCAGSVADFKTKLRARVQAAMSRHKVRVGQVVLAATGGVPAATVVRFLGATVDSLGLPTGKIFMGYIAAGK
jgi:hypothetical protein